MKSNQTTVWNNHRNIALLLCFCAVSCATNADMEKVSLFPKADKQIAESSHEITLDNETNYIFSRLKDKFGKIENDNYSFPSDVSWSEVRNFYNEKLTTSGWKPDDGFPADGRNYHLAVRQRGGAQAVAVALIETGNAESGGAKKFPAILLPEK